MKQELCNTFGLLCEALVQEASAAINILPDRAKPLVQYLHKNVLLPHDMSNFKEVDKFNFPAIKKKATGYFRDSESKFWLIVLGTKGAACISPNSSGYWKTVIYNKEEGIVKSSFARIDEAIRTVKSKIGSLQRYYEGYGKIVKQRPKHVPIGSKPVTVEDLMQRLRPTFAKSIEKAIADMRGMVITQIKNDAYEKVNKKISKLAILTQLLELVQDKSSSISSTSLLGKAINAALLMTASQYYPEETGDITRNYSGDLSPDYYEGLSKVSSDLAKGDMKKLATVLYYMRRELIAL